MKGSPDTLLRFVASGVGDRLLIALAMILAFGLPLLLTACGGPPKAQSPCRCHHRPGPT